MRCTKCGAENREGAKFCNECAAPLAANCPVCAALNKPGAKFCDECGSALAASPRLSSLEPQTAQPVHFSPREPGEQPVDGERKTVTALFADIKGSMELMEDLDPEEARAIVDPALRLMIDAARRYDGYIVQSTGDGIFALFGAPVAHEDHPQRALHAALRLQEDLKRYSDRLRQQGMLPLQARVGVNSGEAVVRTILTGEAHTEYTPIGHSTGLASRMQTLAPVGSIAVTDVTRKLCEGYFTFKSLGATQVKGVSEPVAVYEVTGLGPLRTRLQVAAQRGFTKFVGRQAELEQMKHALELARAGHGQIVAAMGEPGVGKSRLFYEFKAVGQGGCLVLEAYSVSHGKASAYLPVIDLLKNYFEILNEDDERKRREKVAGKVVILDRTLEDTLPYLYSLLAISESDDALATLDPQTRRRRTLEAIKRIAVRESLSQPLIVIFEDLHWIDSETQALLNLLVDAIATARILLLVNYRPEYHHQWGSKTYYTQLRLDPLAGEGAEEMLGGLLGESAELAPLRRLITDKTEGNPFFMEEMVQALFEQGVLARNGAVKLAKPLSEICVPPTVQAILASRIDRLPPAEKELLQTLAALGREFSSGLIKRVAGKSDEELEPMLSDLQLAEFIYEQPAIPDIEYTFKHALTQEVAYNSVLSERRRLLHERAAEAIEALFSERVEDHLAELAHHYDRSGNVPKAVEYLGRMGQRAAQQAAHAEAAGYFRRAIELLKQLPDDMDRARQELDLQMALGWSLFVIAPAIPERESVLLCAQELCERLGDRAKLAEALLPQVVFRLNRGEGGWARELAQRALALAEEAKAPTALAGAHSQLAFVLFTIGQLEASREHLERAVELFGPGPLRSFGDAHYARLAAGVLTGVLIYLGYPATALRKSRELLAAARRLSDPFSIAVALSFEAINHLLLRDSQTAAERAAEMLSIAAEHGMLPNQQLLSHFFRGAAMSAGGQGKEGIAEMRRTILDPRVLREPVLAAMLAALAAACGKHGLREEGLEAVAMGLARAERTGNEAELHRVKGELLLKPDSSGDAEAERCFRTAIDIARRQAGRLYELRATTSLAQLFKRQGKVDEARQMLAEIYAWFTEGFEFADLKDAKALLDELGA